MMIFEVREHGILSDLLRRAGRGLPEDCSGYRGCGKCVVKLLSGIWECDGRLLVPPCPAVACRTRLKSCIGEVELPDGAPRRAQISAEWESSAPPLPRTGPAIAVDMGTTTLAAVRIEGGEVTASASALNGQCAYGDNVMTRIARSGEGAFPMLRKALLDSVGQLLEELDFQSAERIGVAGNTVMSCFLHGVDPKSIGVFPFAAPQRRFPERRDLWGPIPVVTVPCLTGLLGGDITAGLYESPLDEGELFIDLGTNCEMVFRTGGGLTGSSAAAGPAFEGAGISCGSRAVTGAADHWYGGGRFSVIGGGAPRSFCGSALLDFLAAARKEGTLSAFGRFTSGAGEMELAPGVKITEEDIAELLKAKAAVESAIEALEVHTGGKVRKLTLAGGFSRWLDLESARAAGMLPSLPTTVRGNLSLAGAARIATEPARIGAMAALAEKIEEVHLNEIPGFPELFTAALRLP